MHRYKSNFIFTFFLFQYLFMWGQDVAIGQWRAHLPYQNAVSVVEAGDKIYCATKLALFSYDRSDNSLEAYSKATGLSDIGVSTINYNAAYDQLLVAYENTNIDLISDNGIINISDIKRKSIAGAKSIYNVHFIGPLAYLACSFGIVVLDMVKKEIKDTYYIGSTGNEIHVYDITSDGNSLFAATEEGIKEGSLSDPNLANFNAWYLHGTTDSLPAEQSDEITYFNNKIYASISDTVFVYNDTIWTKFYYNANWKIKSMNTYYDKMLITEVEEISGSVTDARIAIIAAGQSISYIQSSAYLIRPLESIKDNQGNYWVADEWKGLIKYNAGIFETMAPNGPVTINTREITILNNELWVASGNVNSSWNYMYNRDGFFSFIDNTWYTNNKWAYPALDTIMDFITVAINPLDKHIYLGSYGGGIVEFYKNDIINIYKKNSTLQEATGDNNSYRVGGLTLDNDNNLWIANYAAPSPISVKKANGGWKAFSPPFSWPENAIGQVIVDDSNQKWFVLPKGNGLLVFNDGGTIDDISDDQYKKLGKGEGNGNLPSLDIYCIEKDLNGQIWVGTSQGIAIFYCPEQVFSGAGCDAQQILVDQGGYYGYLLESEIVKTIAIDGANRKWIGTTNGVWLMSADGIEEVLRFTEDNSPLLSDDIIDIAVDHETGEIFMGTEMGLISYKSMATMGGITHENVYVYPNPVREDYYGLIAIKGLVQDAKVKITDISGNLIYQATALGGQAIWDGNNYNGEKAKTGVYLVFSTNDDGSETYVTKFLIIN